MSEHSVMAPGLPGAQILESGINSPAPAPAASAPAHVSDTAGMNESQAAAMKFVDSTRGELAKNLENHALARQHREALDHALRGGPAPSWLHDGEAKAPQLNGNAAIRNGELVDSDSVPGIEAAYAPMDAEGAAQIRAGAVLAGLPREAADSFMKIAEQVQLPHGHAKSIATRMAQHYRLSDGDIVLRSEQEHEEYAQEAARLLGGTEKYQQTVQKARAYLESVGSLSFIDAPEMQNSTIVYDPAILLSLANLADARGVKAK
jgi:hypothetical protein